MIRAVNYEKLEETYKPRQGDFFQWRQSEDDGWGDDVFLCLSTDPYKPSVMEFIREGEPGFESEEWEFFDGYFRRFTGTIKVV